MKTKNKNEILRLLDAEYDEDDKLRELYWDRSEGSDEERIKKIDAQQKSVVDAYEKVWDLIFQTFEKEGIHCISQVDDWNFEEELKNTAFDAMDQIWNAKDLDKVIAFSQKILSFDWEEGDKKYGESWTIEGNAKDQIAQAYIRKGDLEKADALYESYIQEDYARGEYWFSYINPKILSKVSLYN